MAKKRDSKGSRSILKGAAILGLAGLVCKALGVVQRIFLGNVIGTSGMGNYQLVFSVFGLVLTASTGGIPIAISRLVAERTAKRDPAGAYGYFSISVRFLAALGMCFSLLLFVLSAPISRFMGLEAAELTLKVVSPAVFLVAITSAYRGYYQGMQNMIPTAVSQVAEQIAKIVFTLYFAQLFMKRGAAYGAAGAMIGISISEAVGFFVIYCFNGTKQKRREKKKCEVPFRKGLEKLLTTALPMTVGSSVLPIVNSIDSAIVMSILLNIGYSSNEASSLFGLYTGFVLPLISIPAVLSSAVSMTTIPVLTAARVNNRGETEKRQVTLSFKISTMMGIPMAVGMFALADPILRLLYGSLTASELGIASEMLRIMAPGVFFLAVSQILGGVLQGMGMISLPVVNLLLGAVVKVVMGISLMSTPELNIKGAAIGTVFCYMVTAVLNGIAVVRYSDIDFSFGDYVLKPLIASAVMGGAAQLIHTATDMVSHSLSMVFSLVAAGIIYVAVLFLTGACKVNGTKRLLKKYGMQRVE